MSTREWTGAFRTCKSMALRSEIIAMDAPPAGATPAELKKQLSPFTVTTHNCIIELIQPAGKNKDAVFAVKESESITYSYERDTGDPRIAHNLNILIDEFGNVLESAAVVYPRSAPDLSLPAETQAEQGKVLITYTQNKFTNHFTDDVLFPDIHRLPLLSESTSYELKGVTKAAAFYLPGEFDAILTDAKSKVAEYFEMEKPLTPGKAQRRLIEHSRSTYYNSALNAPLPLHQASSKALSFQTYQKAYSAALLNDIFSVKVPNAANLDALMNEGKFIHGRDENNVQDSDWWISSGTTKFIEGVETDADAQDRFYTPLS